MNIQNILESTNWKLLTEQTSLDTDVSGVYCSDLLSWVMGNGQVGQAWITIQAHINIIAVAELREFSCIILAENANASEDLIAKANEEGVTILASDLPVYETACRLKELGL